MGSKITANGDYSHDIKRLLGRKVMTNIDSILKSRDITLPTKVCLVKTMVFLVEFSNVVLIPATAAPLENLSGMQIIRFYLRPTESETVGWGSSNLCFGKRDARWH